MHIPTPSRAFFLILTLFVIEAPLAVRGAPPAAFPAPAQRFDRGLLWRVDVPGAAPSYLFGSLHSDDDRLRSLPPPVRRAFSRSRVVAMEALNDEPSVRRFRAAMVSRDAPLPELLGEEAFLQLEPLLREHGIPRDIAPRLKPWSALLILLQPRGATGFTLDNLLSSLAGEQHKPLIALETVEEQIAAFDDLPEQTQLALLRHVGPRYDEIQAAVFPLVNAYLSRDLEALFLINGKAMGQEGDMTSHNDRFLERVLYQRSERFAERLHPLLRRGGVFAIFGALHLYGERGVPGLLERRGFRIRPVY